MLSTVHCYTRYLEHGIPHETKHLIYPIYPTVVALSSSTLSDTMYLHQMNVHLQIRIPVPFLLLQAVSGMSAYIVYCAVFAIVVYVACVQYLSNVRARLT